LEDKSTEIIVSCDLDDHSMKEDYIKDIMLQYKNVTLLFGENKSKIEAVNANLSEVNFDILLLASDDMIPMVKGFDTIIKNKMSECYPDTDGVLWFNDGHQENNLNTLCIIGKKYYDRFGYIYNPEYKSVYCDNEFMDVANILNKQTYFPEVIIQHQHPDWGYGNMDTVHSLNQINCNDDMNTYYKNKLKNFGI
jgi:hypothetical protein